MNTLYAAKNNYVYRHQCRKRIFVFQDVFLHLCEDGGIKLSVKWHHFLLSLNYKISEKCEWKRRNEG